MSPLWSCITDNEYIEENHDKVLHEQAKILKTSVKLVNSHIQEQTLSG